MINRKKVFFIFTHLHLHSEYSLLDGFTSIKRTVEKAKKDNMKAIAITDHGVMYGVIDFYKECKKEGIKPIIGCELYICKDIKDKDKIRHHLILLAKNQEGYKNLCYLVSKAWQEGFYYKPRIDFEMLKKHSKGLICLSACMQSEVAQRILQNRYEDAKEIAKKYKDLFKEDYYLEIQDHKMIEDKHINEGIIKLGKELGIKVVCTNDCHYVDREDAEAHDILLAINQKKTLNQERMRFPNDEFYFKTDKEMRELFLDEFCDNTNEVADKCNLEFDFGINKIPVFKTPNNIGEDRYLKELAYENIPKKYNIADKDIKEKVYKRINKELDIISKMQYSGYFLIVNDFIRYAKDKGILVGPGRGSAAGSVLSYLLGITELDPLENELIFERFLNPDRVSMPDIDIDFDSERRDEVIEYVSNKYSKNRVCQISTFMTFGAKASVKDVARTLEFSYSVGELISKKIGNNKSISDALKNSEELKEMYEKDPDIKKIIDLSMKIEGFPKSASRHAAGVLITDKDIYNYAPLSTVKLENSDKRGTVVQFPAPILEDLGLLKMDFLSLRNLTVMDSTYRFENKEVDINDINFFEHPWLFEMLKNGDTYGLFQLESQGMTDSLKKIFSDYDKKMMYLNKDNIDEVRKLGKEFYNRLIAGIALYRPGPMAFIPDYVENMRNPLNIKYDNPLLEDILSSTYGIIIYQEQVQKICQKLAGYTLAQADNVRRIMGKKKVEKIDEEEKNFIYGNEQIKGCIKNGISEHTAKIVWDKMKSFAQYAFNKSHSACYAVIAIQTMYLKYYYKESFFAANINSYSKSFDKLRTAIINVKNFTDIEIVNPDINMSEMEFYPKDGKIYFGLNGIKNVGNVCSFIKDHKYDSFKDFLLKNYNQDKLNKKTIEGLIKSGALDSLGLNRQTMMMNYPNMVKNIKKYKKANKNENQLNFFNEIEEKIDFHIETYPEYSKKNLLKFENDTLGFFISGHPLNIYKQAGFESNINNWSFKNVYIVLNVNVRVSKKGNTFAILSIQDSFSRNAEVLVFGDSYDKLRKLKIEEDDFIIMELNKKEDENNKDNNTFFARKFEKLKPIKPKTIKVNATKKEIENLKREMFLNKGFDTILLYENKKLIYKAKNISLFSYDLEKIKKFEHKIEEDLSI